MSGMPAPRRAVIRGVFILLGLWLLGSGLLRFQERTMLDLASRNLVGHADHPARNRAEVRFHGLRCTVRFPVDEPSGIEPGDYHYTVVLHRFSGEVQSIELSRDE